jgi:hypothetical protein
MRSLYDSVKALVSLRPQAAAAGTINGTGADTSGYNSAMLVLEAGAVAGSPTAQTLDVKVQESDDNSTFTDVTGWSLAQITAANQSRVLRLDGLDARKRYVRAVAVVGFTGGTSPTWQIAAEILLGRAYQEPVNV